MKLHLLATPLLATGLLLSTLGCSKKDDPSGPVAGTGSYKLDGVKRHCDAYTTFSTGAANGQTYDEVEVRLTTTPQPASGIETLDLFYSKKTTEPNTAYQLLYLISYSSNSQFSNDGTTITPTSGGGLSGTFAGTAFGTPKYVITEGVFTDARKR